MAKSTSSKSAASSASKPYTVLARRYRSREFAELIGQEPIARTLLNAIDTGRTAHAYLFCGTRGVGKTSMARIFAKALNATADLKEREAIGDAILRGDDLDVIEIDGASYRGVNEARDLIAGAGLSPARSPYKIYIIDEVHQLTRDAFNALLKTMEEPPSHVKFILCTTEPQKVPATIQSRCQRFDFRAISTAKIAGHIRDVLKAEGIKADDEVVTQVARLGNGSMRDALSILDRLLAGGVEKLTVQHLEEMLGLPDHDLIVGVIDACIAGDGAAALKAGDELLQKSSSVEQALDLLTDHLRSMMILSACGGEAAFLDLSEEHMKTARRQAASFDAPALVHMIALCDAVSRNARGSATARALFDAAIVRLAMSQRFADIPTLLAGGKPVAELEPKKKEPPLSRPAPVSVAEAPSSPARAPSTAEIKPPPQPTLSHQSSPAPPVAEVPATAEQLWDRVLQQVGGNAIARQCVEHLAPVEFNGSTLRLRLHNEAGDIARFVLGQVERVTAIVRAAAGGRAIKVEIVGGASPSREGSASSMVDHRSLPPIVRKAVELFDATVVKVE